FGFGSAGRCRQRQMPRRGGADEVDDLGGHGIAGKPAGHGWEPFGQRSRSEEQRPICLAQLVQILAAATTAVQADGVQTVQPRLLARGHPEGDDVAAYAGDPADHRAFADTCKLMNSGKSTKKNVIAKTHVTTQGRAVGEGYVVADMAIVTDM